MKPVARRRIRMGLTAACVAVAAIFVASCARGLFVHWESAWYNTVNVSVVRGAFHANYADSGRTERTPGLKTSLEPVFGPPLVEWAPTWSFGQGGMYPAWAVRVPLWMPLALLGAPCGWVWWRCMRQPANSCRECGYDLIGTRGNVCPECGGTKS